jgi:hypothetical protein
MFHHSARFSLTLLLSFAALSCRPLVAVPQPQLPRVGGIFAGDSFTCAALVNGQSFCFGGVQLAADNRLNNDWLVSSRDRTRRPFVEVAPAMVRHSNVVYEYGYRRLSQPNEPPEANEPVTSSLVSIGWDRCSRRDPFSDGWVCSVEFFSPRAEHVVVLDPLILKSVRNGTVHCELTEGHEVRCASLLDRSGEHSSSLVVSDGDDIFRFRGGVVIRRVGGQLQEVDAEGPVVRQRSLSIQPRPSMRNVVFGDDHACGIVGPDVYCFGDNRHGQIGSLHEVESSDWHLVYRGRDILSVVAGAAHTCALERDGSISCWGERSFGRLLDPVVDARPRLVEAVRGRVASAVVGADFTCALLQDGAVTCWGRASGGHVGWFVAPRHAFRSEGELRSIDRSIAHALPVPLSGNATQLRVIEDSVCAFAAGEWWCWGGSQTVAPYLLPDPGPISLLAATVWAPRRVQIPEDSTSRACGPNRPRRQDIIGSSASDCAMYCGLNRAGAIYCDRLTTDAVGRPNWIQFNVSNSIHATGIAVSETHACAWTAEHDLYCWGSDRYQQLGRSLLPHQRQPTRLTLSTALQSRVNE